MTGEETSQTTTKSAETSQMPEATKLKDHVKNAKAKEPTIGTGQEQGAPKEEQAKPGNHQNKTAKATSAGTSGEETSQTIAEGAKNKVFEAIGASMAG